METVEEVTLVDGVASRAMRNPSSKGALSLTHDEKDGRCAQVIGMARGATPSTMLRSTSLIGCGEADSFPYSVAARYERRRPATGGAMASDDRAVLGWDGLCRQMV